MRIAVTAIAVAVLLAACDKGSSGTTSAAPGVSESGGAPASVGSVASASASASAGASPHADAGAGVNANADASASLDAGDLPAVEYATYKNPRYAFTVDVPTFFTPKPADANGAGQAYHWKTRATMRAWGAANSSGIKPKEYYEDWVRRPGVTDKKLDGNTWFVAGKENGRIYFSRCVMEDKMLTVVDIEYEEALASFFLPIREHVATSFTLLAEGPRKKH